MIWSKNISTHIGTQQYITYAPCLAARGLTLWPYYWGANDMDNLRQAKTMGQANALLPYGHRIVCKGIGRFVFTLDTYDMAPPEPLSDAIARAADWIELEQALSV